MPPIKDRYRHKHVLVPSFLPRSVLSAKALSYEFPVCFSGLIAFGRKSQLDMRRGGKIFEKKAIGPNRLEACNACMHELAVKKSLRLGVTGLH